MEGASSRNGVCRTQAPGPDRPPGGLPSGVWYTPAAAPLPARAGEEARGPLDSGSQHIGSHQRPHGPCWRGNPTALLRPCQLSVGSCAARRILSPNSRSISRRCTGRGCIWRRPLVAVVGVLPSLQVAVSGRSVLLPRDSAAVRMCACAFNGLYSPGPLQVQKLGRILK